MAIREREIRQISWQTIGWLGALLITAYFPILKLLVWQWRNDDDASHGFFVPIVALYITWQRRHKISALPWKPSWWGVAILLWAALQAYIGVLGAELFLQRTAFLLSLVGVLLLMGGAELVRRLMFPLLLLLFMIPIPTVLYNKITFPLQLFASHVAEVALSLLGIPVWRDGNVLELASQKLSVVEACSGIRSLLSLSFFAVVYAYFCDTRIWMGWALLIATIPIAIFANAGRVTLTGFVSEFDKDWAEGIFHSFEGLVIFFLAITMLILLRWLIHRSVQSITYRKRVKERFA